MNNWVDLDGISVSLDTVICVEVERGVLSSRESRHLEVLVDRLVHRFVKRVKSRKEVKVDESDTCQKKP